MLPTDTHARRILATDRHELLRGQPPARRPAGHVRRSLGALLVGAGVRLAPDAAAQHRSQAPRRWAEYAARQPRPKAVDR